MKLHIGYKGCFLWIGLIILGQGASQNIVFADYLYFTEAGFSSSGTVSRVSLDNFNNVETVNATNSNTYSVLALDSEAGKVYVTGSNSIIRANVDGTNEELLISNASFSEGLALDLQNNQMYWTQWDGSIHRANLDGSNSQTLIDPFGFLSYGLALDVSGNQMYWTTHLGIYRANLDGTNAEFLVDGGNEPLGIALDLVHNKMYWADWQGQKVWRANLDGSDPETIYSTAIGNPIGIAIDPFNEQLYWSEWNSSRILRADLDGGNVQTLFNTTGDPWGIALDIIPEPATVSLFALGALVCGRRKLRREK